MNSLLTNATPKRNIVLYFQVHQPKRLGSLRFFDIGTSNSVFNDELDRTVIQRIAQECYLPTNAMLLRMIQKHPEIKLAFSISGITIERLEEYAPEVLESFRILASTGNVEFLAETYYHSLSCMIPGKELESQILKHTEKMLEHFGLRPSVFRNTELIYNDDIGTRISRLGFTGVITEGTENILGSQSANHVYQHPEHDHFKVLLRNYRLSDDIAFRFNQHGERLTVDRYISWLKGLSAEQEVLTLGMDYETFGEHQKRESGIVVFLQNLLDRLAMDNTFDFVMPSVACIKFKPTNKLSIPHFISWADQERDLSAWLGNEMQRDAFDSLVRLEYDVKNINAPELLEIWRGLQTSDHFYYMSTKKGNDGTIHNYFSPYPSPYEAFINYMNVLTDFSMRVKVMAATTAEPVKLTSSQTSQSMGQRMTMLEVH